MLCCYLLFFLLLHGIAQASISGNIVTSDGTQSRPYCAWEGACYWDVSVQNLCALKLCQASGYSSGTWVSDSGSVCTTSVQQGTFWAYDAGVDAYKLQVWALESRITAQCTSFGLGWKCIPYTAQSGFIPVNRPDELQCASSDGKNCLWWSSLAECQAHISSINSMPLQPLKCGAMHYSIYGITGYDTTGHWCNNGRLVFPDGPAPSPSPSPPPPAPPAPPAVFDQTQDIYNQCSCSPYPIGQSFRTFFSGMLRYIWLPAPADGSVELRFFSGEVDPWNYDAATPIYTQIFIPTVFAPCSQDPQWQSIILAPGFYVVADQTYTMVWQPHTADSVGYCYSMSDPYPRGQAFTPGMAIPLVDNMFYIGYPTGDYDQDQLRHELCKCTASPIGQSFRPSRSGVLQRLALPASADGTVVLRFFRGEVDPLHYDPAQAIYTHVFTPSESCNPYLVGPQWQLITLTPGFSVVADQSYTVIWAPGTASEVGYCFRNDPNLYTRGQGFIPDVPWADTLFRIGFPADPSPSPSPLSSPSPWPSPSAQSSPSPSPVQSGGYDQEQLISDSCGCTAHPLGQSFRPSISGVLQYLWLPAPADGSVELFFFRGEIDPLHYDPAQAIYSHTFIPAVLSDPCAQEEPQWQSITLTPGFSVVAGQAYTMVWARGTARLVGYCYSRTNPYPRGQAFEIGVALPFVDNLFRIGHPSGGFDQQQVEADFCMCYSSPVGQSFRPSFSGILQYLELPAPADGSVQLLFFRGEIDPLHYDPAQAIYSHTFIPAVLYDPCEQQGPQWQSITLTPGFSVVAEQIYTVVWAPGTARNVGRCYHNSDTYLRGQAFEIGGTFPNVDALFRIDYPTEPSPSLLHSPSPLPSPPPAPPGGFDQELVDAWGCGCSITVIGQSFRPSISGLLQYLWLPAPADGSVKLFFFSGEVDPLHCDFAEAIYNDTFTPPAVSSDPCYHPSPRWQSINLQPGFFVVANQAYSVVWAPGTAKYVGYCETSADAYLRGRGFMIGQNFISGDYLFRTGFPIAPNPPLPSPPQAPSGLTWKCVPYTGTDGLVYTPVSRPNEVQCASVSGTACLWLHSLAECQALVTTVNTMDLYPLKCGAMHYFIYSITGYDTKGHWCQGGVVVFPDAPSPSPSFSSLPSPSTSPSSLPSPSPSPSTSPTQSGDFDQHVDSGDCGCYSFPVGQSFIPSASGLLRYLELPIPTKGSVNLLFFRGEVNPRDYSPARSIYNHTLVLALLDPCTGTPQWQHITLWPGFFVVAGQPYSVVWAPGATWVGYCRDRTNSYPRGQAFRIGQGYSLDDFLFRIGWPIAINPPLPSPPPAQPSLTWKCIPYTGTDGLVYTPVSHPDEVQCASVSGTVCLWSHSLAECEALITTIDTMDLYPLKCGIMHYFIYSITGYDTPSHWCVNGLILFPDVPSASPSPSSSSSPVFSPSPLPTPSPTFSSSPSAQPSLSSSPSFSSLPSPSPSLSLSPVPSGLTWKCIPYTGTDGLVYTPVSCPDEVQCASVSGTVCLWSHSLAECEALITTINTADLHPLKCGAMHNLIYSITGYDTPDHWCSNGLIQCPGGIGSQSPRPSFSPTASPEALAVLSSSPMGSPKARPSYAPSRSRSPKFNPSPSPSGSPESLPSLTPSPVPSTSRSPKAQSGPLPSRSPIHKRKSASRSPWRSRSPSRSPWRSRSPSPMQPVHSPKRSLSPNRSPKQSLSPTHSPWQSRSPSRSSWRSNSPSRSPWRSHSPSLIPLIHSPKRSLSPNRSPKQSLSPSHSPKRSLSPSHSPKHIPLLASDFHPAAEPRRAPATAWKFQPLSAALSASNIHPSSPNRTAGASAAFIWLPSLTLLSILSLWLYGQLSKDRPIEDPLVHSTDMATNTFPEGA